MRRIALFLTAVMILVPMPATANEPKISPSSVGVQLFMWNWNSVAKECRTQLGPNGFDWVLVMPPQEHIIGPQWWVHYQPVSYKLESRLGTRSEFANMVSDCNAAGVKVIADAVINHMVGGSSGIGSAGSAYSKYNHPGLYASNDFHEARKKISNWNDLNEVQNYELLGLSDLATEKPSVQSKIAGYLNDLLSLGVYGFRIDAARHTPVSDLAAIKKLLPNDTYFLSEVASDYNPSINDYLALGDAWEFDWVGLMNSAFGYRAGASNLPTVQKSGTLLPGLSSVTMVSNHDTERSGVALTSREASEQQLAFIYTLASDYGKPMVYSGYSFLDPDSASRLQRDGKVVNAVCPSESSTPKSSYKNLQFTCQHRWKSISGMLAWRDSVGSAPISDTTGTKGILSVGRGAVGQLIMNSSNDVRKVRIRTKLAAGVYCDLVSGGKNANLSPRKCAGKTVIVDRDGIIQQTLDKKSAIAFSIDSKRRL